MALLNILEYPDPRLRTKATPVDKVDDSIRRLIDDMLETMYAAPGVGLAASQVDVHKRIIVVDVSDKRDTPYAFINPQIDLLEGEQETQEGCLSIPGFYELVTRADRILVLDAPTEMARRSSSLPTARWQSVSSTSATISRASCSSIICRA
jgi:peptide deformylase